MSPKTKYVVGLGAAAVSGAAVAQTDPFVDLLRAFSDLIDRHGLPVAISAVCVIASLWLIAYLLKHIFERHEAEVTRLVGLRDQLWDQYLSEKPSSQASPGPAAKPRPKQTTKRRRS